MTKTSDLREFVDARRIETPEPFIVEPPTVINPISPVSEGPCIHDDAPLAEEFRPTERIEGAGFSLEIQKSGHDEFHGSVRFAADECNKRQVKLISNSHSALLLSLYSVASQNIQTADLRVDDGRIVSNSIPALDV